jgi:hypothetical protein
VFLAGCAPHLHKRHQCSDVLAQIQGDTPLDTQLAPAIIEAWLCNFFVIHYLLVQRIIVVGSVPLQIRIYPFSASLRLRMGYLNFEGYIKYSNSSTLRCDDYTNKHARHL